MKKVFVNGTFDLLHRGHLELLNYAKSKGDYLVVAIDADERIRSKKGSSRPIYNLEDRKFFLECLKPVDKVYTFCSDFELESLVNFVQPAIMIVGSDWKYKKVIGSEYANELIFFDRIKNYASTSIIQSIIDRG
jgi:D-beta-D-heptose 7-phosphate kinase/D-beta-D-heptose 1-phosphate adenosyltransferase